MSEATGIERRLGWYAAGQHIALDVARGLHFLHKSGVRFRPLCRPHQEHPSEAVGSNPGAQLLDSLCSLCQLAPACQACGITAATHILRPLHTAVLVVHPGC